MKSPGTYACMASMGFRFVSHGPVESSVLPLVSEREVTRQGTGQRCSNDSFHEESITQAWRDEHLRGGGTMEHRETAFEGEDG